MPSLPGQQRGFSLLELILVLVIIGIIVAAVTITISDRRIDELKVEAQRLSVLIPLAVDEAVMTNRELGLVLGEESYYFLEYNDDEWQLIDEQASRQFRTRDFPEGVFILKNISGLYGQEDPDEQTVLGSRDDDDEDQREGLRLQPDIMMLSSAELTPFIIRLAVIEPEPAYMQLKIEANGEITMSGPIYEPAELGWSSVWQD